MKGNLSQFEVRVANVINETYKNYKNDVAKVIGYLQNSNKSTKEEKNFVDVIDFPNKDDR